MRILHLCDSLNPAGLGGYESYLYHASRKLHEMHHQVIIATQAPARPVSPPKDYGSHKIVYLSGNYLEARKWEFFALREAERADAVRDLFHETDLQNNVSLLRVQLCELIAEFEPDIIHAHSTYVVFNRVIEQIMNSGTPLGIPKLVTIHGLPKPLILPDGKETTDYDEFCSHFSFDLVTAVSNFVLEKLKDHFKAHNLSAKTELLYLGVDLDIFRPMNLEKIWDIAFFGRLERMKGVDLFPQVFSRLLEKIPSFRVLMTGEGSLREGFLQDVKESNLQDVVDFRGVVEGELIPSLMNKSKVFLYPSRCEPFGLSLVEAMACGVPVVTTNICGPAEIITDGLDGIAVEPDDIEGLCDAILSLLLNDGVRKRMGLKARETACSRFGFEEHVKRLVGTYGRLIVDRKNKNNHK